MSELNELSNQDTILVVVSVEFRATFHQLKNALVWAVQGSGRFTRAL